MKINNTMISIQQPSLGLSALCEPILYALPEWFGIEEANQQYLRDIDVNPTFIALTNGEPVGFLTLVEHSEYAAEIHVMAVLINYHRRGVGRALLNAAETYLKNRNIEFLQVKTLSSKHPSLAYKATRDFYLTMGFRPLQEFPYLWGVENPCLQLIKTI